MASHEPSYLYLSFWGLGDHGRWSGLRWKKRDGSSRASSFWCLMSTVARCSSPIFSNAYKSNLNNRMSLPGTLFYPHLISLNHAPVSISICEYIDSFLSLVYHVCVCVCVSLSLPYFVCFLGPWAFSVSGTFWTLLRTEHHLCHLKKIICQWSQRFLAIVLEHPVPHIACASLVTNRGIRWAVAEQKCWKSFEKSATCIACTTAE